MISGFIEQTSGELLIKGRSMLGIPPEKRPVNIVRPLHNTKDPTNLNFQIF